MKKVLIFASGGGSNFEAIVKCVKSVYFELLCDKKDAYVLKRAKELNVRAHIVKFEDTYDFLREKKFDLYVLAGYMRILPMEVLNLGRFINIHPSLLPCYKGKDAIKRQFQDKVKTAGVSVHYVSEEVDSGEIIVQESFMPKEKMSYEDFEAEFHKIEHRIYPSVIKELLG